MPKQTLYFTNPAELSLSNGQLKIRLSDEREHLRPIEDIRILIVDHHSVHLTVPLLTKLSENNVSVVFCNESHIPVSMTMDLDANCRQTKYFNAFPLVDDVMEPYRPFVDERVFALFAEGVTEIDRRCKQELLEVFYSVLNYDILSDTAHSLAGIYSHTGNYMVYPILK